MMLIKRLLISVSSSFLYAGNIRYVASNRFYHDIVNLPSLSLLAFLIFEYRTIVRTMARITAIRVNNPAASIDMTERNGTMWPICSPDPPDCRETSSIVPAEINTASISNCPGINKSHKNARAGDFFFMDGVSPFIWPFTSLSLPMTIIRPNCYSEGCAPLTSFIYSS